MTFAITERSANLFPKKFLKFYAPLASAPACGWFQKPKNLLSFLKKKTGARDFEKMEEKFSVLEQRSKAKAEAKGEHLLEKKEVALAPSPTHARAAIKELPFYLLLSQYLLE